MFPADFYRPPVPWTGRTDGTEEEVLRWHQRILPVNLLHDRLPQLQPGQHGIAFLGFACDEGVRRNQGRTGAAEGPAALRKACAGFPVHFNTQLVLTDTGDILCPGNRLEEAQEALTEAVLIIRTAGYFPLLLGGGHEITYGHARGIRKHLQGAGTLGLLNFDAHFDLRIPGPAGSSSGTGFWQLAQEQQPFHYLALGIQMHGNTQQLFRIAGELDVRYVEADAFHMQDRTLLQAALQQFIQGVDHIYLTIDLDVFAAAFAPGVSAAAYNGILPGGVFLECYRMVLQSGKLAGMDIAELSPALDIDNRTAKLGAALVFEAVTGYAKV